jgi:hypothetical protein
MLSHMLRAVSKTTSSANLITYTAQGGSSSNANEYTFSSVNIGAASGTREVFVVINWSSSDLVTLTSANIGGLSATIASQNSSDGSGAACIFRTLTTGTTATIFLNFSGDEEDVDRVAFSVYSVTNRTSPNSTATDSDHASGIASSPIIRSTQLTIPGSGFALGQMSTTVDIGGSLTITPFTRNNYNTVNAGESVWYMSSSYNNTTGSSLTPTITISWTGGNIGTRTSFYAFP